MIDVRCTARQPGSARSDDAARCQLLAGHEDPHAVMFCRDGRRVVRTWCGRDRASLADHVAGQELMPWVMGLPCPAWSEAGEGLSAARGG